MKLEIEPPKRIDLSKPIIDKNHECPKCKHQVIDHDERNPGYGICRGCGKKGKFRVFLKEKK